MIRLIILGLILGIFCSGCAVGRFTGDVVAACGRIVKSVGSAGEVAGDSLAVQCGAPNYDLQGGRHQAKSVSPHTREKGYKIW